MKKPNALIVAAIVLACIGIGTIFFPWNLIHGRELFGFIVDTHNYQELGGFVGGISSPFISLAAFMLLYATYQAQKEELHAMQQATSKQQFESTFFNLLNAHTNSTRNLVFVDSQDNYTYGALIFEKFREKIAIALNFERNDKDSMEEYENIYDSIHSEFFNQIETYLRTLDTVSMYVERVCSNPDDAKMYYSIIASQLNETERTILQYQIKLQNFESARGRISRIKKVLWRTGTISLSDFHDFILDPDIHSSTEEDDERI